MLDQRSANRTFINNQRVDQAFLQPGSQLRLGAVTFEVRLPAPSAPQVAAAPAAPSDDGATGSGLRAAATRAGLRRTATGSRVRPASRAGHAAAADGWPGGSVVRPADPGRSQGPGPPPAAAPASAVP